MTKNSFTLIEAIIAISILVVGLAAILCLFSVGLRIKKSPENKTVASYLAQEKMEEIVSKSYNEICQCDPLPCSLPDPCEQETHISADPDSPFYLFEREVKVYFVDPENNFAESSETINDKEVKEIKVTVSFPSLPGSSKETISLISLIAKR